MPGNDKFLCNGISIGIRSKNYYPDYTNSFSILKSNIYSLNNSMRIMMEKFDHPEKFMAEGAQIKEAQEG